MGQTRGCLWMQGRGCNGDSGSTFTKEVSPQARGELRCGGEVAAASAQTLPLQSAQGCPCSGSATSTVPRRRQHQRPRHAPHSQCSPAARRWPWPAGCPSRGLYSGGQKWLRLAEDSARAGEGAGFGHTERHHGTPAYGSSKNPRRWQWSGLASGSELAPWEQTALLAPSEFKQTKKP